MNNSSGAKSYEFRLPVTAKDNSGKVLGTGKYYAYDLSEEGAKRAAKRMTWKGVMTLVNQASKTNARNDLARTKSVAAQTKAKEKSSPDFAREIEALRAKHGIK